MSGGVVPFRGERQAVAAAAAAATATGNGEVRGIARISNGGELGRESSEVELRRLAVAGGRHWSCREVSVTPNESDGFFKSEVSRLGR